MAQNLVPPPVPTQSQVLDPNGTGLMSKPWIYWCTKLGQIFGFYQTIYSGGVAVPQETGLDFEGLVVTDDPTNGRTVISVPAAAFTVQNGTATTNPTGGNFTQIAVVFATPFSATPRIVATPGGFAKAGASDPMSCILTDKSAAGFTINLTTSVPFGGGGSDFSQAVPVDWLAIG